MNFFGLQKVNLFSSGNLRPIFSYSVLAIEETAVKCETFIEPAYPLFTPYGSFINHLSVTKPSPTI